MVKVPQQLNSKEKKNFVKFGQSGASPVTTSGVFFYDTLRYVANS